MLFAVNDNGLSKDNIVNYLRETKIKYRFAKQAYLQKIKETQENERISLIKKINMNNVLTTTSIPQNLIDAIPRPLRIFPRDFAQKETQITIDTTEEMKKQKNAIKAVENGINNTGEIILPQIDNELSLHINSIFYLT